MPDYAIISYHNHYLDAAARLYEHAYAVPNGEKWDAFTLSREIVIGHALRDSFIGVLAVSDQQEIIGLAWGYATPTNNANITQPVIKLMGEKWVENTFMVEAFAMHFEHHSPALVAALHDGLVQRVQEQDFARMRIRLNIPRLDNLAELLAEHDWQRLKGMAHVMWLGKELG